MFWFKRKEDRPGVYRIVNTQNGREYIGATNNPMAQRWRQHLARLRSGRHSNKSLQADWNAYGEEAFVFEVVEVVTKGHTAVFAREVYWQDRNYTKDTRYNPPNQKTEQSYDDFPRICHVVSSAGISLEQFTMYDLVALDTLARLMIGHKKANQAELIRVTWQAHQGNESFDEWSIALQALMSALSA